MIVIDAGNEGENWPPGRLQELGPAIVVEPRVLSGVLNRLVSFIPGYFLISIIFSCVSNLSPSFRPRSRRY